MSFCLLISACCLVGPEPIESTKGDAPTFQVCFTRPETLQVHSANTTAEVKSDAFPRFNLTFDEVHSFRLSLKGKSASATCKILAKSGRDEITQYLSTCAVPIQVAAEDWDRIENGNSVFRIFVLDRSLALPSVQSIRTTQDRTVVDLLLKTGHDDDLVMYMELCPEVNGIHER